MYEKVKNCHKWSQIEIGRDVLWQREERRVRRVQLPELMKGKGKGIGLEIEMRGILHKHIAHRGTAWEW